MTTSAHTQILQQLESQFALPSTWSSYNRWITGEEQLNYIVENMRGDEFILHANGPRVFVDTLIVNRQMSEAFLNNQLPWDDMDDITFRTIASYFKFDPILIDMLGYSSDYLRRIVSDYGSLSPPSLDSSCSELLGVKWSNEKSAFCVVSNSTCSDDVVISATESQVLQQTSLVTCKSVPLMRLLRKFDVAMKTDSVLLRNFDFHLFDEDRIGNGMMIGDTSHDISPADVIKSDAHSKLVYRRRFTRWRGGYVRGVQVVAKHNAQMLM